MLPSTSTQANTILLVSQDHNFSSSLSHSPHTANQLSNLFIFAFYL